jgi:hypothetical protein
MNQAILTAAVGVVAAVASYFAARLSRPKIEAEARHIIGDTYKGLINELRTEIDANTAKIASLEAQLDWERKRNYALEAWAKALAAQVIELGDSPEEYETYRRMYVKE